MCATFIFPNLSVAERIVTEGWRATQAQPGAQIHAALCCQVTDQGTVTAAGDGCDLTDPPCRSWGAAEPGITRAWTPVERSSETWSRLRAFVWAVLWGCRQQFLVLSPQHRQRSPGPAWLRQPGPRGVRSQQQR